MTKMFADNVAKTVERFFENFRGDTQLQTIAVVSDESTSRSGTVSYSQPVIGDYGIFSGIMKDAYLAVRFYERNVSYYGRDCRVLCVDVGLHYKLASGGSNGNSVCSMTYNLDGKFGPTLLEYRFDGQETVILENA